MPAQHTAVWCMWIGHGTFNANIAPINDNLTAIYTSRSNWCPVVAWYAKVSLTGWMSNSLTGIGWRFTGINPNRAFWAWLARLCGSWSRPIFRACPAQKTFHGWVFQTGQFGQCFENPQIEAIPIMTTTCSAVLKQEIYITCNECSRCVDADPHDFPNHM